MMPQIKEEVSKKLKKELGIDIENSELSDESNVFKGKNKNQKPCVQ